MSFKSLQKRLAADPEFQRLNAEDLAADPRDAQQPQTAHTFHEDCWCNTPPRIHEDDSYGACTICREYVAHTDEEFSHVAFPCAVVREAEAIAIGAKAERDFYTPLVAEAFDNGAKTERERCIEALRREAQNALDSGIRPSGRELDAWNYVAHHFLDSAAVILAEPEADRG